MKNRRTHYTKAGSREEKRGAGPRRPLRKPPAKPLPSSSPAKPTRENKPAQPSPPPKKPASK